MIKIYGIFHLPTGEMEVGPYKKRGNAQASLNKLTREYQEAKEKIEEYNKTSEEKVEKAWVGYELFSFTEAEHKRFEIIKQCEVREIKYEMGSK